MPARRIGVNGVLPTVVARYSLPSPEKKPQPKTIGELLGEVHPCRAGAPPRLFMATAGAPPHLMSEVTGPGTGCSRPAGGSRSAIEHYHKLRNELQKESNLFECFEHMHKKKNGAFVDERSKRIAGPRHASSFISENSSSSSATSQFHQAAMKEMLNQPLESMQAEMEATLQAERAQMQAQIASLMEELRCNGMLSTSMPRPPTTEAEHSINSNDENL
nr:ABC transporter B family member 11 [Ipomoea batatas]